jgi:hypothetical protein
VYEAAYGALKDFQPLIAALIALAAAITLYISADARRGGLTLM